MAKDKSGSDTSGSSLISDLAGLGAIGEKLLDILAMAVGGLAKPHQIRRIENAKTDAKAHRKIELARADAIARQFESATQEELERRALARIRNREVERQRNVESTLARTVAFLQTVGTAESEPVRDIDDDWYQSFLRYAEDVSHSDIQEIWARVLSDQLLQTRAPVSLATLDSLRLLEPRLAQSMNRVFDLWTLFGNCLDQMNERFAPGTFVVYDDNHLLLQSIGFVNLDSRVENYLRFNGFGFIFRNDETQIQSVQVARLEPSWRGIELARVLRPYLQEDLPPSHSDAFGDWNAADIQSGTIAEWAKNLATLCASLHLVGTLPALSGHYGENVETHRWKNGWERLPDIADETIAMVDYPAFLSAR